MSRITKKRRQWIEKLKRAEKIHCRLVALAKAAKADFNPIPDDPKAHAIAEDFHRRASSRRGQ